MSDTVSEELSDLPEYLQYIPTVIEVQKELGGSGKPAKVFDLVLDRIEESNKPCTGRVISNPSQFDAEMQRVRKTLVHAGLLDSARKGVWTLTAKGLATKPSDIDLHQLNEIRKSADKEYREKRKRKSQGEIPQSQIRISAPDDPRKRLTDRIQKLSFADFEKICQMLLCKSGFERVCIIKRTDEETFEGKCIFQKSPLERVYVLFQFKCVQGLLNSREVKDFRKAMMGRADKGIIMTTGIFTSEALHEARRDGVAPVALVDRNKLIDLIRNLKIQL